MMLVVNPCASVLVFIAVVSFFEDTEVFSVVHPPKDVRTDGRALDDNKIQGAVYERPLTSRRFKQLKRGAIKSDRTGDGPKKDTNQYKVIDEEETDRFDAESSYITVMKLYEIYEFLKEFARENSDFAKLQQIGKSYEKRPIYALAINSGSSNMSTIVVEFGIHAREWASPASAMYFIQQLAKERGALTTNTRWFIVPVLNPDGYLYSMTKYDLWRKNRNPLPSSKCDGVDLNRNFETGWEVGDNNYECEEIYKGPSPFSEPESRAMRDFVESIGPGNVDAYVAVHTCAQSVLYPYAYTKKALKASKLNLLKRVASKMVNAMKKVRNLTYGVMPAIELAISGGNSHDFMFVNLQIPITLTLELGDAPYFDAQDYYHCFHPPSNTLPYLTRECYVALRELATYMNHEPNKRYRKEEVQRHTNEEDDEKSENRISVAALTSHPLNRKTSLLSLTLLLSSNAQK